jgi:hypothetical protein
LSRGKIEKSGGIMMQRGKFYHIPLHSPLLDKGLVPEPIKELRRKYLCSVNNLEIGRPVK